jgi:hypothetical protein
MLAVAQYGVFPSQLLSRTLNIEKCETIILPLVIHGCEIWTLAFMKEHRLMGFENWVLRKIFGSKRQEVTGVWRKIRKERLHILPSDIPRTIRSRE